MDPVKRGEGTPIVAAVINTSHDVTDMLRRALEQAGFVAVTALTDQIRDGKVDLESFIRQHDPRVIVYDIAPPYDANWQFFQHVAQSDSMDRRQFVITSVNPAHVEKLPGVNQRVYEVVGKPLDLGAIVKAVREAARARPTR